MKKFTRIILTFIMLFLSMHAALSAQASDNVSFGHLSVEDGLPHTNVYDMVQDHLGFLWFATEGGVAKYDGYGFTVFQHSITPAIQ